MIRLRACLRTRRLEVLATGVVVVLGLVIAWEHSGAPGHEMAYDMGLVGAICLAVVEVGVGLGAAGGPRRRCLRTVVALRPSLAVTPARFREEDLRPPPRAGPSGLQVFLR